MASGAPGGNFRGWTPTPPERGSFPLDHDGECRDAMVAYLKCMKYTSNQNAPNCRVLAKLYLQCRMDNQLMNQLDWASLGLTNLPEHPQMHSTDKKKKQTNQDPEDAKKISS